jgi:hypothetical protein
VVKVQMKNPAPLGLLVVNGKGGKSMARRRRKVAASRTRRKANPFLFGKRRAVRRRSTRRRNPAGITSTAVSGNPILVGVIGTLGGAGVQAIVGLLGSFGGSSVWADIGRTMAATVALQLGLDKIAYTKKYAANAALGGWFIVGAKVVSAVKGYFGINIPGLSGMRGMGDIVQVPVNYYDQFYGSSARQGQLSAPPLPAQNAGLNGIVMAPRLNY